MATGSAPQLHPDSIDTLGLSVIAGSKVAEDGRYGLIYNPTTLAAAAPVHFHLAASRVLGLFSRVWTTGEGSEDSPGYYSDYTESTVPHWAMIDLSGSAKDVGPMPMRTAHTTRTLVSATSRLDLFWALNAVTNGSVNSAVVQFFRRNTSGTFQVQEEETLPTFNVAGQPVLFNRGVYLDAPNMVFFGSRSSGNEVYLARKRWERIGTVSVEAPWQYQTDTGWSSDPDDAVALQTSVTTALTTVGPISVGSYRDRRYITTVAADGSNRVARVYVSRGLHDPWNHVDSIALGAVGSTYLGGTLYLQPHLGAVSTLDELQDPANATAFPSVRSLLSEVELEAAIQVTWGIQQIPRFA